MYQPRKLYVRVLIRLYKVPSKGESRGVLCRETEELKKEDLALNGLFLTGPRRIPENERDALHSSHGATHARSSFSDPLFQSPR